MDTIFSVQTPALTNENDGQPINTGTTFTVAQARSCTHHRFYGPTNVTGTFTGKLWQLTSDDPATGTLLATCTYPSASAGWNERVWDGSAVALTSGIGYRVSVHNSAGHYVATGAVFTSAGITNGDLTAIQTATDPVGLGTLRNGVFDYGAIALPNDGGGANFFVDVGLSVDNTVFGTAAAVLGALTATAEPEPVGRGAGVTSSTSSGRVGSANSPGRLASSATGGRL